jgi:HPt (histidine-containing phosphotransfer) domain-containing protein/PAS domain-containing protein
MNEPKKRSTIEYNLRVLSAVALALFAALISGLVLVQHSLVASQQTLETVVVPAQQDLGRLDSAIAGMFERQARVSSTTSSKELEALRDRTGLQSELQGAQSQLQARIAAAGGEAGTRDTKERITRMAPAIAAFVGADDELFASVARYHALHEDFQRRLSEAQTGLRGLTEQAAAIAGVVRLNYIVLLRHVARDSSAALVRELVFGDEREQLQCVEELSNAALDLSALSGRIGLASDGDALNSIAANEIAQNRQRIEGRLEDLAELTAHDSQLSQRAEALRTRFGDLTSAIGDEKRSNSLIGIRRAIVLEQRHAAEVRDTSVKRASALTADVAVLQIAANALTAESSKHARRTANSTRFGVFLLAGLGIAASGLGARRVRDSVNELRAQNRRLEQLRDELTHVNAHLEDQVAERTKALAQRERSLQLVLDSTGDGMLSVTLDGLVQAERSRAASAWLGEANGAPEPVWSLFHPDDPGAAAALRMAFEQLVDDALPFELSAEQMPKRLLRSGRTLDLSWKAVIEDGTMKRILVVARDITERLEAEKLEREAKELQDLVGSVLRDKAGFSEGVNDAKSLLRVIESVDDPEVMRRALHTLKGNMAMFGFHQLAAACHELEDALTETGNRVTREQVTLLREKLEATLGRVKEVIGSDFLSLVEVFDRDIDRLMRALEQRYDHAALHAFVASWRDESVETVLRRFAAQASRIAASLDKEVEVVVEDGSVRVPAGELRTFWSGIVHAIRNAIDHGIETPDERVAAGKRPQGLLSLRASVEARTLTLEVEDDGRGIDFDGLREAARRRGLPCDTRTDLIEAMFIDGVTTKSQVTSLSGRGVGMAALRQACRDLGGTLEIDSSPGTGTRLTFRLPLSRPSTGALPSGTVRASEAKDSAAPRRLDGQGSSASGERPAISSRPAAT